MKKTMLLFIIGLLNISCVVNVPQNGTRPYHGPEEAKRIAQECKQINNTGDIYDLLSDIRQDTGKIISIINEGSNNQESKIQMLADEIKRNSALVTELSKTEWTTPNVRHEVTWSVSKENFGKTSSNFYIKSSQVHKVFFLGEEREDLKKRIDVTPQGDKLFIKYMNSATMLEFCQLNETLMVVLEVKYIGLRYINTKYFNLYVKLEK